MYPNQGNNYLLKEVNVRLRLQEGSSPLTSNKPIRTQEDAVELMKEFLSEMDREMVCVINFDNRLIPINYQVVSVGSINVSLAPISNIFKSAILSNAASIMMFHNHPGGIPEPSEEDDKLTEKMIHAGKLMEVHLIDHIIIGSGYKNPDYYSYRQHSLKMFDQDINYDIIDQISKNQSKAAEKIPKQTNKGIWLNKVKEKADEQEQKARQ